MTPPPIVLSQWVERKMWVAPTLTCPNCKSAVHSAKANAGELWLTCQQSTKHSRCRAHWRAMVLRPGTIGGTFAALFGYREGRKILYNLYAQTRLLDEDDLWGWAVPMGQEPCYLQVSLTLEEYVRMGKDWVQGARVLQILSDAA